MSIKVNHIVFDIEYNKRNFRAVCAYHESIDRWTTDFKGDYKGVNFQTQEWDQLRDDIDGRLVRIRIK